MKYFHLPMDSRSVFFKNWGGPRAPETKKMVGKGQSRQRMQQRGCAAYQALAAPEEAETMLKQGNEPEEEEAKKPDDGRQPAGAGVMGSMLLVLLMMIRFFRVKGQRRSDHHDRPEAKQKGRTPSIPHRLWNVRVASRRCPTKGDGNCKWSVACHPPARQMPSPAQKKRRGTGEAIPEEVLWA